MFSGVFRRGKETQVTDGNPVEPLVQATTNSFTYETKNENSSGWLEQPSVKY